MLKDLKIHISADIPKSLIAASKAMGYTRGQLKSMQDTERLTLECRRIMEGVYSPAVAGFMLELAGSRGRLQQLRDLVAIGLNADQVRGLIMAETYIPVNLIMQITSQDITKFTMPAFKQYGRLGIMWRNMWYRLRSFLARVREGIRYDIR